MTTEQKKLIAFHGNPKIKQRYVARVQRHQLHDQIVQGQYWENGKGCAVGCTLHTSSGEHARYETELGIPRVIAYLQDRIFEGLSNEEAKEFPLAFLKAIPVGADLSRVIAIFLRWLLVDDEAGVIRFCMGGTREAVERVGALYTRMLGGETITLSEWRQARSAADAADAYAAAYAAAADAAAAAYAYADAAYAAAAYAYAAAAAARKKHFAAMRDMLLKLLQDAPVAEESNA